MSPGGTGNIGIGFAVPVNMAKNVMNSLIEHGKVSRGYLGLLPQDIDDALAKAMNLKTTDGALVGDVTAGGPSDKAGVKQGDIVTEFNGTKVTSASQLRNLVASATPGSEAKLGILREGKSTDVTVKLGERPKNLSGNEENKEEGSPEESSSTKLGIGVQALTNDLANQLGYKGQHGVVVTNVTAGSPAEEAGLQRGQPGVGQGCGRDRRLMSTVGIVGYGAYVPRGRLPAAEVSRGWEGGLAHDHAIPAWGVPGLTGVPRRPGRRRLGRPPGRPLRRIKPRSPPR